MLFHVLVNLSGNNDHMLMKRIQSVRWLVSEGGQKRLLGVGGGMHSEGHLVLSAGVNGVFWFL